ncbi:ribonuclease HII [Paenisporosarcina antarctica]|uniref:Ribonuclease HII n=1 Tax=Paenisporosarcina antarctica TaxID=417367 RepID=A0A4P6ZYD3_9BACL|nr:ribonuclease HII [Paenisporosarcina antarctica]QBP41477.1 ribonuclease HII [Paenisporosarcina antarctica]
METIKVIGEKLKQTSNHNEWTNKLTNDSRAGVQKLVTSWKKRMEQEKQLQLNHLEKIHFDDSYKNNKMDLVAGIDEAGRGPLAGPVVTAAVIFREYPIELTGINDSKQLSRLKRNNYAEIIKKYALSYSIHIQPVEQIDEHNIYQATKASMTQAVKSLSLEPNMLLVDAMTLPLPITQHSIIKGDTQSLAIAAASILAKTTRDNLMIEFDKVYPEYNFAKNAGYGTSDHLAALKQYGATIIHRKTFEPVKSMSR